MEKRIVLMTANTQGGIIQFTFQLYHALKALGHSVKVCLPEQMQNSDINEIEEQDRLQYHKEKSIFSAKPYKALAKRILETEPDYIWYCDSSVICSQVGLCLRSHKVQQLLTMHDAGGHHPSNRETLRHKLIRLYSSRVNGKFYRHVYRFVLLSQESQKMFALRFPNCAARIARLDLGAHIPADAEKMPPEMEAQEGKPYLLFFGRIDKYKGIGNLLRAYRGISQKALPLVIAGSGGLTEEEKSLLQDAQNVTLINRYIGDGEMKWLFANSAAAVLPYIEATQSGIIPIAYAYGKPVIVSDVPGLTQFVENGETGFVAESISALSEKMEMMTAIQAENMAGAVKKYYDEHLNWEQNLQKMFSKL